MQTSSENFSGTLCVLENEEKIHCVYYTQSKGTRGMNGKDFKPVQKDQF